MKVVGDPSTLLAGERRVLEMIATGRPLEAILDQLCRVIDDRSGLRSSIFLLDASRTRLHVGAGPHLPETWLRAVHSFPLGETACGEAVRRREPIVSADIQKDPLYAGYYDAARASDIAAVWSTPFYSSQGRPLGTFAVYASQPGAPSPEHLMLVERATSIASIAVEHHQSADQLARSLDDLHALTGRLMSAQDDERRNISRHLHETTAQDLAALKMLLARLGRTPGLPEEARPMLAESIEIAERLIGETRTISHVLHPPFLDDVGLLCALRWYVDGFAKRSGIATELDAPDALVRLPQDVETTLFRVVQEALLNIVRHARSAVAAVHLQLTGETLTLDVADRGRGFVVEPRTFGIGITGMRERVTQLGGTFDIVSRPGQTNVQVTVPLTRAGNEIEAADCGPPRAIPAGRVHRDEPRTAR